ncbi:TPA_asm: N [Pueraria betacytorhabdovirus 1]|nr:TPA_asm: N [Pueraria betacytorhabdovirus 1]
MAQTSENVSIEIMLKKKYENVKNPVLTSLVERKYSDADAKTTQIYNVFSHSVNKMEFNRACKEFERRIREENVSGDFILLMLFMASNLRKISDHDDLILNSLDWPNQEVIEIHSLDWSAAVTTSAGEEQPKKRTLQEIIDSAKGTYVYQRGANTRDEDVDAEMKASWNSYLLMQQGEEELLYANKMKNWESKGATGDRSSPPTVFWPFYAAYLMKLYMKKPENVEKGLINMMNKYKSFYDDDEKTFPHSLKLFEKISTRMKSHQKVINTWVALISNYESGDESDSEDSGIIRFLAGLQFGYNGMQCYALFKEVLLATKWNASDAIIRLYMDPTVSALDTIADILSGFESIRSSDGDIRRPTLFRYARILDPRFFLPLQASQSAALSYLCCKILGRFHEYSDFSNPENMVIFQKMGREQKRFLNIYVETLMSSTMDSLTNKTQLEIAAIEEMKRRDAQKREAEPESVVTDLVRDLKNKMGIA